MKIIGRVTDQSSHSTKVEKAQEEEVYMQVLHILSGDHTVRGVMMGELAKQSWLRVLPREKELVFTISPPSYRQQGDRRVQQGYVNIEAIAPIR